MSSDSSARSPWTGVSQFLPTTQKLLQVSYIDDASYADIKPPSSFPTAKAPSPARRLFMLPALLTFSTSATSTSLKKFAVFNLGSSSKKMVLFGNTSQCIFFFLFLLLGTGDPSKTSVFWHTKIDLVNVQSFGIGDFFLSTPLMVLLR